MKELKELLRELIEEIRELQVEIHRTTIKDTERLYQFDKHRG